MTIFKIFIFLCFYNFNLKLCAQYYTFEDTLLTNIKFYKSKEVIKIKTKFFHLFLKTNDSSIVSFEIKNISNKKIVIDTKRMYLLNNKFHCFYTDESDSLSCISLAKNQVFKSKNYFFNMNNFIFDFFLIINFSSKNNISWREYLFYITFNENNKKKTRKIIKRKL